MKTAIVRTARRRTVPAGSTTSAVFRARRSASISAAMNRRWSRSPISRAPVASCPTRRSSSRSRALHARARAGEPLAALRASLFALAREASRRVLGQRPFDEQIVAALALDDGHVVEMQTGEGKTLAAVMPAALNAFTDRGVHVLTFNDYLARRDAEWMGPVYRLLGLSVGYVQQGMPPGARRAAYARGHHLRHREGSRIRPPARSARDGRGRSGAPAVPLRARGRGRLADDRRGAGPARDRGQRRPRRVARAAAGRARRVALAWRPLRHRRVRAGHRADRGRHRARRAGARVRRPAPRREPRAADRAELRAPRPRPAPPRRRLHRPRRPDRDRRRVHRPRRRGSSLARWPAGRARSQGGPRAAARRAHSRLDDAAAVPARLSPAVRHDRHREGLARPSCSSSTGSTSSSFRRTARWCASIDEDVVFTHREAKERAIVDEIRRAHATGRPGAGRNRHGDGVGAPGRAASRRGRCAARC